MSCQKLPSVAISCQTPAPPFEIPRGTIPLIRSNPDYSSSTVPPGYKLWSHRIQTLKYTFQNPASQKCSSKCSPYRDPETKNSTCKLQITETAMKIGKCRLFHFILSTEEFIKQAHFHFHFSESFIYSNLISML